MKNNDGTSDKHLDVPDLDEPKTTSMEIESSDPQLSTTKDCLVAAEGTGLSTGNNQGDEMEGTGLGWSMGLNGKQRWSFRREGVSRLVLVTTGGRATDVLTMLLPDWFGWSWSSWRMAMVVDGGATGS